MPIIINLFQLCLQTVCGGRSEGGEGNTYVKGVAMKTGVLTFFNVLMVAVVRKEKILHNFEGTSPYYYTIHIQR